MEELVTSNEHSNNNNNTESVVYELKVPTPTNGARLDIIISKQL
jgi:hypothetical protein